MGEQYRIMYACVNVDAFMRMCLCKIYQIYQIYVVQISNIQIYKHFFSVDKLILNVFTSVMLYIRIAMYNFALSIIFLY